MRDYTIDAEGYGNLLPVSSWSTAALSDFVRAINAGEVEHSGVNGSATQEDVLERIKLELEIRGMGLSA